jgi:hypothetical protein
MTSRERNMLGEAPPFSFSVGERKLMNHSAVRFSDPWFKRNAEAPLFLLRGEVSRLPQSTLE